MGASEVNKEALASLIKRQISDPSSATPVDPLTQEQIHDLKQDRELKKRYANWFIGILIVQLVLMNIVFVAAGAKYLSYDKWGLDLYMGGTLLEVFGVVLVITKNLFPQKIRA
jgi:hypothetical protein